MKPQLRFCPEEQKFIKKLFKMGENISTIAYVTNRELSEIRPYREPVTKHKVKKKIKNILRVAILSDFKSFSSIKKRSKELTKVINSSYDKINELINEIK